jgi:DNA polymerase III delta prime subunit
MSYSFSNLAPADFEDLVRDLVGRELGMRFEAFGPGPDGGMDGRHAKGRSVTILQAKHYAGSPFKTLLSAMKRERLSIDRIAPTRYLLATSRPLTPANKNNLGKAIGPALRNQDDILSAGDLNGLLRKYSDIERAHIKLWLSSAVVLERVTRAAAHAYAAITKDDIATKVRVYAQNPSFKSAQDTLESQHVLIISGPPGVGKTTLAEMLSYAYVGEDWNLIPVRSLDDGFAAIVDSDKQIFLFDDFLGKVALDKNALASKDSDLSRFMNRVRHSPNARFILTTRAYIFEEARRVSEYLADVRLDISKYVLDVGVYTRRIRARILYNHLLVAGTPAGHIRALIESGEIAKIVDHANYNPRVIEWMTDSLRVGAIAPEQYADAFLSALANPKMLWDTAFRTHIPEKCRHLLYALFFGSQYGEDIADLRLAYQSLHPRLCSKYGQSHDPKDFEESVRILEGGFISIRNGSVSFINPSFRDYLTDYLDDLEQLKSFANSARQADWARQLWFHGKKIAGASALSDFARAFDSVAREFLRTPTWKKSAHYPNFYSPADLANADRIDLLINWWEASGDEAFARLATDLAAKPVSGFTSWRDGTDLIELIENLRTGYYDEFPFKEEILDALQDGVIAVLSSGVGSDDLERISDAIAQAEETLGPDIVGAAREAIHREFDEIDQTVADTDSESTLEEQKATLKKLAPRAGIADATLASALETVNARISALAEETEEAEAPSFSGTTNKDTDKFDDRALMNLFAPLLDR